MTVEEGPTLETRPALIEVVRDVSKVAGKLEALEKWSDSHQEREAAAVKATADLAASVGTLADKVADIDQQQRQWSQVAHTAAEVSRMLREEQDKMRVAVSTNTKYRLMYPAAVFAGLLAVAGSVIIKGG